MQSQWGVVARLLYGLPQAWARRGGRKRTERSRTGSEGSRGVVDCRALVCPERGRKEGEMGGSRRSPIRDPFCPRKGAWSSNGCLLVLAGTLEACARLRWLVGGEDRRP